MNGGPAVPRSQGPFISSQRLWTLLTRSHVLGAAEQVLKPHQVEEVQMPPTSRWAQDGLDREGRGR